MLSLTRAKPEDLDRVKCLFKTVTRTLDDDGIPIWNDSYPLDALQEDIELERLYLLDDPERPRGALPAAAFAILERDDLAHDVSWQDPEAGALYLYRLGVDPALRRQGVGRAAMDEACRIAAEAGVTYLRLLVVDFNAPAISFYERCGFVRVPGECAEHIVPGKSLVEYGYERKL